MTVTSAGLGRRGRPPAVTQVNDTTFATTVRGKALKFTQGAKGLRLANRNTDAAPDDVEYGKAVVSRYLATTATPGE